MKKVLLLSLSLVLGFSAFAQQRVMKNDARKAEASAKKELAGKELTPATAASFVSLTPKSVVVNRWEEAEDTETIMTFYDLQSNQYVANRMYQLPNGSVAVTATMSHEPNQTASDRGTGYNFFDGAEWAFEDLEEMTRVEPFKTGWPSIAQYGANGEILLAHGGGNGTPSGMQCFIRETAGEGEWIHVGTLPAYPEGYAYTTEYPTWPRIVTCGTNHNIAVAAAVLQHSISSDETDLQTVVWRSENPADINSWTVTYGPLHDLETPWDHNQFSADDYCMAANGNTVALLYSGCLTNSVWMFKSTDCGLTWTPTRVWENPYEGREFDEEPAWGMEDTLYMPMNGSVVVDNGGTVHVALNTFEMAHTLDNEPGYYSYYYGRGVDGILYWNDTQEPIQDTEHPEYIGTAYEAHFAHANQHHAARLWWPMEDESGYVHMVADSTKWIGMIPMFYDANGALISWDNNKYYMSDTEYISKFYGASGHPALSCDPNGNLACAFSSPCTKREDGTHYYRSIFVSYYNVAEGYWHQLEDEITDPDFLPMLMFSECLFTNAVSNTINPGEFWFSYQADESIGFYWGSNASQPAATENMIHVTKVIANPEFVDVDEVEAQDPIYGIYPNPVVGNIMNVKSAMDADATITIVNLVGQTVKQFNQSLHMGDNAISIDLKSGVYFCTINANGFNNTVKFVVK